MSTFPRVGDVFAGYAIESELGRGAMGVVFRARQERLDRPVALKVVAPSFADLEEFRARFSREASVLAALDSPHVISIFDHGEQDGCLYTVTQLVRGADLGRLVETEGPLDPVRGLRITAQVAAALAAAHEAGVVHRDVKPSNVLLRRLDDGDHAYLCDFGIARGGDADAAGLTRTGSLLGTYGYLAPECCEGSPATPSSDLYALGCLLVTMLTGQAPYVGSDYSVMRQHVESAVTRWQGESEADRRLDAFFARSMAKDPADRYASAVDLRSDVQSLLDASRRSSLSPALGPPHPATVIRTSPPEVDAAAGAGPNRGSTVPHRARLAGIAALVIALLAVATYGVVALRSHTRSDADAVQGSSTSPTPAPPTPTAQSSAVGHPCWNGTSAASSQACPVPRGRDGLRYVFPSFEASFRRGDCEFRTNEIDAPASRGMDQSFRCHVPLPSGRDAFLNYGSWRTWDLDLTHYRDKYRVQGTPHGQFLVFAPARVGMTKGALQTSRVFRDRSYRFSVTAIAYTPQDLADTIAQMQARSVAQINR